jgi:hypothetical protein
MKALIRQFPASKKKLHAFKNKINEFIKKKSKSDYIEFVMLACDEKTERKLD